MFHYLISIATYLKQFPEFLTTQGSDQTCSNLDVPFQLGRYFSQFRLFQLFATRKNTE